MLAGVGIGGEDGVFIHLVRGVNEDLLVFGEKRRIGKVVHLGKHGLGLAVVAIQHRHRVLEGGGVVPLGKNAAAGVIGPIHPVIVVKQVVCCALDHGVVDVGAGHLDPGVDFRIDVVEAVKVHIDGHIFAVVLGVQGLHHLAGADAAAQLIADRLTPDILDDKQDAENTHDHRNNGHHGQQDAHRTLHRTFLLCSEREKGPINGSAFMGLLLYKMGTFYARARAFLVQT